MAKPIETQSGPDNDQEKEDPKHKQEVDVRLFDLENKLSDLGKRGDMLKSDVASLHKEWVTIKDEISDDEKQASLEKQFLDFQKKIENFQERIGFADRLNVVETALNTAFEEIKHTGNKERQNQLIAVESDLRSMEVDFLQSNGFSQKKLTELLQRINTPKIQDRKQASNLDNTELSSSHKSKNKKESAKKQLDSLDSKALKDLINQCNEARQKHKEQDFYNKMLKERPDLKERFDIDKNKDGAYTDTETAAHDLIEFLIKEAENGLKKLEEEEIKEKEKAEIKALKDLINQCNEARQKHKEQDFYNKMLKERPDLKERFDIDKNKDGAYTDTETAAHDLIEFLTKEAEARIRELESSNKKIKKSVARKKLDQSVETEEAEQSTNKKEARQLTGHRESKGLLPAHEEAEQSTNKKEARQLPEHKETPTSPEKPKQPEKNIFKKFNISLVDITDIGKSRDRDAGNRAVTDAPDKKKGILGRMFGGIKRAFTREGRRQKAIAISKKKRQESGHFLASEGRSLQEGMAEMSAVADRFSQRFDEAISEERGEIREQLENSPELKQVKQEIKNLILSYAQAEADFNNEEILKQFNTDKQIIMAKLKELGGDITKSGDMFADNLLNIVKQVRLLMDHDTKAEQIQLDFDFIVGKAKDSVRTEEKIKKGAILDRIVDKMQRNIITRSLVNESTGVVAVLAASNLDKVASKATKAGVLWGIGASAASLVGLGVGAGLAGLYSAGREGRRWTKDREQHAREVARGDKVNDEAKMRKEQETYRHETVPIAGVLEAMANFRSRLESADFTERNLTEAMAVIADAEARINLSNQNRIDLLAYSDIGKVEQENTALLIEKNRLKVLLKEKLGDPDSFEEKFREIVEKSEEKLKDWVDEDDKAFAKAKRSSALKKGLLVGSIAGVVGVLMQEGWAALSGTKAGVFEHATSSDKSTTLLHHLFKNDSRAGGMLDMSHAHTETVGAGVFKMPNGSELVRNSNGTYDLLRNGEPLVHNLGIGPNGKLSPGAVSALRGVGCNVQESGAIPYISGTRTESVSIDDYANHHPGEFTTHHRLTPYGYGTNNAEGIERNELELHFGGNKGTGLRSDGKYEFSIKNMFQDRSATGKPYAGTDIMGRPDLIDTGKVLEPDQIKHLVATGDIKAVIIFDKANDLINGGKVLEVPITPDGKIVIDPNSLAGQAFHATDNKLHIDAFRFGIVQKIGPTKDGSVDVVRYLARTGGKGIDHLTDKIPEIAHTPPTTMIDIPSNEALPFDAPIPVILPHERANLEGTPDEEGKAKKIQLKEEKGGSNLEADTGVSNQETGVGEDISSDSSEKLSEDTPQNPLDRTSRSLSDTDTDNWVETGNFAGIGRGEKKPAEILVYESDKVSNEDSNDTADTNNEDLNAHFDQASRTPGVPDYESYEVSKGNWEELYKTVADDYLKGTSSEDHIKTILEFQKHINEPIDNLRYREAIRAFGITKGKMEKSFMALSISDRNKLITKIFRNLSKELHPDVNKVLTQAQRTINNYHKK